MDPGEDATLDGDKDETVVAVKKRRNRVDPDFEQFELFLQELKERGEEGQRAEAGEIHRRWFTDEGYLSSLIRISSEMIIDSMRFLSRRDLSTIALVDKRFLRLINSTRLANVQVIPRLHIEMFNGRMVVDGQYHGRFDFDVSAALDNPPPSYVRFRSAVINYTCGEVKESGPSNVAKSEIKGEGRQLDESAETTKADQPSTSRASQLSSHRRGQTSTATGTKNESDVAQHFLTSSSITKQFHGCELELQYFHSLPASYIDGLLAGRCFSNCRSIALTIRGSYHAIGTHLPILTNPALLNCATIRLNVRSLLSRIAPAGTRQPAAERNEDGERQLMERFFHLHRRLGRGGLFFERMIGLADGDDEREENRQRIEDRRRAMELRRRRLAEEFAMEVEMARAIQLQEEEGIMMVEDDDTLDGHYEMEEILDEAGENQFEAIRELALRRFTAGDRPLGLANDNNDRGAAPAPPPPPAPLINRAPPRVLPADDLLERYIGARDLMELLHQPMPDGAVRRVSVMQVGVDLVARSFGEALRERFEQATEPLPYVLNFPNIQADREQEPVENETTREEFSYRRAPGNAADNDGNGEAVMELGRLFRSRRSLTYRRLPKTK